MNEVEVTHFSELIGHVMTSVTGEKGSDVMEFIRADGKKFNFYHSQDCCESVMIESIHGDLQNLVGEPILIAEEIVHNGETPEGIDVSQVSTSESYTWTFYKFATIKGHVDVRWFGSSNGYYSESVDFAAVN